MSANDAIEGVKEEESKQQKKIAAQKDKLKQTEAFAQDLKSREDKVARDKKAERNAKRKKLEIDGKAQRASELEEKKEEEAAKAKIRACVTTKLQAKRLTKMCADLRERRSAWRK